MKTIFALAISDALEPTFSVSRHLADELFSYFKTSSLFRWSDANNDCEDRANALCILLDAWGIDNCKAWVFSGYVFRKKGFLKNFWKYHVAAAVPILIEGKVVYHVLDPATTEQLTDAEEWAINVTDNPFSYFALKRGEYYIFNPAKIFRDNWFKRNKRNYNWTMQGLSGINGMSVIGKAQLRFNKKKVLATSKRFEALKHTKPSFLLP